MQVYLVGLRGTGHRYPGTGRVKHIVICFISPVLLKIICFVLSVYISSPFSIVNTSRVFSISSSVFSYFLNMIISSGKKSVFISQLCTCTFSSIVFNFLARSDKNILKRIGLNTHLGIL